VKLIRKNGELLIQWMILQSGHRERITHHKKKTEEGENWEKLWKDGSISSKSIDRSWLSNPGFM
jgi:hypothetical protein